MSSQTHMLIDEADVRILTSKLGLGHDITKRAIAAVEGLRDERQQAYRKQAQTHTREGELEVDDGAVVSEGDDLGAYVAAWIFVYADDAGVEPVTE